MFKIFKSPNNDNRWLPVIGELQKRNYDVYGGADDADGSIVLGGQFENPLALSRKRILIYHKEEWLPRNAGFSIYEPILKEYYDEMVDVTTLTLNQTVDKIEEIIVKHR